MRARAQDGKGSRTRVAVLEAERARLLEELASVRRTQQSLQAAQARLAQQLAEATAECERLAGEYVKMAHQTSELANLYVASLQLRAGSKPADVLLAIQEIVVGLIGCEELAVFELDRGGQRLERVWRMGIDEGRLASVPLGSGAIGRAVATGESFVADGAAKRALAPEEADLSACVPLKVGGRVTGAVALFRLLPHKAGFEESDRELFNLLACHGASALNCARRHTVARSASR